MSGNFGANNPTARFIVASPDTASLGARKTFQTMLKNGATVATPKLPSMNLSFSGNGRQLSVFRRG